MTQNCRNGPKMIQNGPKISTSWKSSTDIFAASAAFCISAAGAAPLLDWGGEKGKTGREEIEIGNTDRGLPMCDSGLLPFNDDVWWFTVFDCLFFKFSPVAGDQDKMELPLPALLSTSVKLIVIAWIALTAILWGLAIFQMILRLSSLSKIFSFTHFSSYGSRWFSPVLVRGRDDFIKSPARLPSARCQGGFGCN